MIAIVGGGITGLALGWELARRGVDLVVLEAGERPGGVIRSGIVQGHTLDWGPQRLRLTREVSTLVDGLGLEEELLLAPEGLPLWVFRDGRLWEVPFSAGAFFASGAISVPGKLRLLLEPFTAGPDPDERVSSYFERKIGRELYETIVAPLYGGLYASDPADMVVGLSLAHVLREFRVRRSLLVRLLARGGRVVPPAACTFREGMQRLPQALAAALGERLRLGTPARSLRRGGSGWIVELDDGRVEAERVVLSVPAPAAARLLEVEAPAAAAGARALRYNPLAVVHLEAETDLHGLGFQVAFTERSLALRGVTFNDSLFGRAGLYTAYLGGARMPEVAGMGREALEERAVEEFRVCTGFEARPLSVVHEKMPAWDYSWSAIRGWTLPDGLHVSANWTARPGVPGRLAAARRLADTLSARG